MPSGERHGSTFYRIAGKRAVDIGGATFTLLTLSPLLVLAAAAIKIEDGGPVFFRQARVGRGGRTFSLLKFRSMPQGAAQVASADAAALRVTRVGKILRRSNIDELPQLVNILRGEMSIVGPRPALPSQEELLRLRALTPAAEIAPGLTGRAQVEAFSGMTPAQKAEWDVGYAEHVSFLADVKIVLRTIAYLFRKPPVY